MYSKFFILILKFLVWRDFYLERKLKYRKLFHFRKLSRAIELFFSKILKNIPCNISFNSMFKLVQTYKSDFPPILQTFFLKTSICSQYQIKSLINQNYQEHFRKFDSSPSKILSEDPFKFSIPQYQRICATTPSPPYVLAQKTRPRCSSLKPTKKQTTTKKKRTTYSITIQIHVPWKASVVPCLSPSLPTRKATKAWHQNKPRRTMVMPPGRWKGQVEKGEGKQPGMFGQR